jgi:hypothetical protein
VIGKMSGRRYVAGKPHFMGAFKKKALDALKILPLAKAIAMQNIPFPALDQAASGSCLSPGAPMGGLQPQRLFIDQQTWDDIKAWSAKDYLGVPTVLGPMNVGSCICSPRFRIYRPAGLVLFRKPASLWVTHWAWDKTVEELYDDVEDYEDYRVRQCEEAVLGKARDFGGVTDVMRKKRGVALALDMRIRQLGGDLWYVPSSGAGTEPRPYVAPDAKGYRVDMKRGTCECPDYKQRKQKCKHQYAVEHLQAKQYVWKTAYSGTWLMQARRAAKMAHFGMAYGMSPTKVAKLVGFDLTTVKLVGFDRTKSGRFSSKQPNLSMGSPRAFTDAEVDFAALETQLMASLSPGIQPIVHVHKDAVKQLTGRAVRLSNGSVALSDGDTLTVKVDVTIQEQ